MYRSFRFALPSAAFLFAALPAAAASPSQGEPFAVRVAVADLDLGSEEGRRTLRKRVRYMAGQTCNALPGAYEPRSLAACRQAFDDAAAAAVTRAGGATSSLR